MERDPALSVILAARDEERSVKGSVTSLLAQDYPGTLEVIAVNDRSTDRTGEILDELATRYPGRLRVSDVESLPEGWLGKAHALYTGAAERNYHHRQRGSRVAGDTIFSEGVESVRSCSLAGSRSHKETWAGCTVSLTTSTRSALSASRSVSLRSWAEKTSKV